MRRPFHLLSVLLIAGALAAPIAAWAGDDDGPTAPSKVTYDYNFHTTDDEPTLTDVDGILTPTPGADDRTSYSVSLPDSAMLPVGFAAWVDTTRIDHPTTFSGDVVIPAAIAQKHGLTAKSTVDSDTAQGAAIIEEIALEGDATPVVHGDIDGTRGGSTGTGGLTKGPQHLYVAAVDNVGAQESDAAITTALTAVSGYWTAQSAGYITSFGGAESITHYASTSPPPATT